jgi:hypothetical protein
VLSEEARKLKHSLQVAGGGDLHFQVLDLQLHQEKGFFHKSQDFNTRKEERI